MAAQFAPLATVTSSPYFLKYPFSAAITNGEQSVNAMIPQRSFDISGASPTGVEPAQPRGKPANRVAAAVPRAARFKKVRRESCAVIGFVVLIWRDTPFL